MLTIFCLIGLAILVFVIILVTYGSQCTDCIHDNRFNVACENCEHYKHSLRYDWVDYERRHDHFSEKGIDKDAK